MGLTIEVRRVVSDIQDALASSLDIREAVAQASPLLLNVIKADYAALGVTKPGCPGEFDWVVAEMPPAFFAAYPEMAGHDFVLRAVLGAPNRVLRDNEMIPRRALERNLLYGAARDLGMPIEQVMSTMLHVDDDWSSGLSLYRSHRDPFGDRDREVLESVTPALKHAVRNCRLFATLDLRRRILDELVARDDLAVVVFGRRGQEIVRSEPVNRLLARWFDRAELGPDGLPTALTEYGRRWACEAAHEVAPRAWTRTRGRAELVVRAYWLSERAERFLAVTLKENPNDPAPLPEWKDQLTEREHEVAEKLLLGWDNQLIADEIGCAHETVKKHVSRIFNKLGVDRRSQLIDKARRKA